MSNGELFWQESVLTTACSRADRWRGNYFHREGETFSTDGHRLVIVSGDWLSHEPTNRDAPNLAPILVGLKRIGRVRVHDLRAWCEGVTVEYECDDCGGDPAAPQPAPEKCRSCGGSGECPCCFRECDECDGTGFSVEGCEEHGKRLRLKKNSVCPGSIGTCVFDRRMFFDLVSHLPGDTAEVFVSDLTVRLDGEGWTLVVMGIRDNPQPGTPALEVSP